MKKVLKIGSQLLKKRSVAVSIPLSQEDKDLIKSMIDYIEYSKKVEDAITAVGLAAPQIGESKRIFVIDYLEEDESNRYIVMVNPIIRIKSGKLTYLQNGESCLSVPEDVSGVVLRHHAITIEYIDGLTQEKKSEKYEGYYAIVIQHEYDHLDGILYPDRIGKYSQKQINLAIPV